MKSMAILTAGRSLSQREHRNQRWARWVKDGTWQAAVGLGVSSFHQARACDYWLLATASWLLAPAGYLLATLLAPMSKGPVNG